MAIKYNDIFYCKTLQNLPKFWFEIISSGNPAWETQFNWQLLKHVFKAGLFWGHCLQQQQQILVVICQILFHSLRWVFFDYSNRNRRYDTDCSLTLNILPSIKAETPRCLKANYTRQCLSHMYLAFQVTTYIDKLHTYIHMYLDGVDLQLMSKLSYEVRAKLLFLSNV
jgi:hypothetical protein